MITSTSNIKINAEYFPYSQNDATMVFLLHGFTGSSNDWDEIIPQLNKIYSYVAVDSIGHGKSESPEDVELYAAESIVQQLDEIFNHFTKNKFILIGYSMGGRAALSYAAAHPDNLLGLVLESTSAGIADDKLRGERVRSDEKIIKIIEDKSLEEFVDFWMNQDLFTSLKNLPKKMFEEIKKQKTLNSKLGLINSLRRFGTGVMPPLHDKLHLIKCKTLLVTGELDTKFTQINSELVNQLPIAKHVVVKNAGHNVHLEQPGEFVKVVNEILYELEHFKQIKN